jgi:acetyl-CoA synthetase
MSAVKFLESRDFLLEHRTDYEFAYERFRWPALEQFNWALDYFDGFAAGNTRTGLTVVDASGATLSLSFAELFDRSNQAANFLRRVGVRRGDRLLVMLGNEPALWDTLLAAFKLGAVVIPAATLLPPADLGDRLQRAAVQHVVAGSEYAPRFEGLAGSHTRIVVGEPPPGWQRFDDAYRESARFDPDGPTHACDPMLLYFTSGTTSRPKLVLHSHQSYPVGHLSTLYWLGLQPKDVHWNISSPGWAKHAWSCFFTPWMAGASIFVYNYSRFQPADVLGTLERHGITTLCAPPTVWRTLIQEDLAAYPVKLREAASAGEPLNPEVISRVRAAWGVSIRDGYGQTETTAIVGNSPGQPIKPGSMGRPLPGYRVELLDAENRPAAEGQIVVDLSVRPLGLLLGYAGDTEGAARLLSGNWYHTGDIAMRDPEGYLTYVGRADDVFKSSDYRISPFELESALLEHPAVAEAAIVPSPDPRRLSVPKAFIVLSRGYTPGPEVAAELFAFIRRRLAPYQRIRLLEFAALPKTISGKIRRAELRRREQHRASENPLEYAESEFR